MILLASTFLALQTGFGNTPEFVDAGNAPVRPVLLRLGPENEILGWLVAKEPKTPYVAEGDGWKLAVAGRERDVDFGAALGGQNTYALAGVTLHNMGEARKATLLFGTDDGGTLTLNGKQIWSKTIVRGVKRDEERVELDLKPGANALVFRVDQGTGGWGLVARLENGEGIFSSVTIRPTATRPGQPAPKEDHPSIRAAAAGDDTRSMWHPYRAFDAELAERYDDLGRRATLWNARIGHDPKLATTTPTAVVLDADWNGYLERSYRTLDERYRAARAPYVAKAQNPGPLFRDVKAEIGVRVMPGGRQFALASGKPFVPIGYNHNPDWTEFAWANPLNPEGYDPKRADARFAKLQANGVNVVRMMAETPPSGNLEDAVGTFSPEHMTWLDNLVTSARRHNVRIMLTPYDTFWMNLRVDASPYWAVNGGPMDPARKSEWYTAPRLREAHKRRNHWLIDRYGNLDTIFAWEPMNEADLWWDPNPEQLTAWADDVVADAKAYQRSKWGVDRLFTVSSANPFPEQRFAEFFFRSPDLDVANAHLYIGLNRKSPKDASDVIEPEMAGVRHALARITDARPFIDTENGPIDGWIESEKLDDLVFHDQSWSHLASGGAGSGFRWPYRNPHHLTDGMLAHLGRMRKFADAVDWTKFTGKVTLLDTKNYAQLGVAATGYSTSTGTIVFAARLPGQPLDEVAIVPVRSAPTGRGARVYDTIAGKWSNRTLSVQAFALEPGVRSACAVWDR